MCRCVAANKRNAQRLRNACRTIETMDLVDGLKISLHPKHVHWMISIDTSTVTLDELEDTVFTMGQHVDSFVQRVLSSVIRIYASHFT
jgi:hypothetical protein